MKPLLIDTTLTLFSGPTYAQYDLETGQLLTAPRLIADGWSIPFRKIDAAVYWEANTVYFLNAMQVVRYRLGTGRVDPGYPKIIPFYWRGLWASDIDAVLRLGQQTYFFHKSQYIKYDVSSNRAEFSSAQPIASLWQGLPKCITGAVPVLTDHVLFFSDDGCYLHNNRQKKVAGPVPFPDVIQDGISASINRLSRQEKSGKRPL